MDINKISNSKTITSTLLKIVGILDYYKSTTDGVELPDGDVKNKFNEFKEAINKAISSINSDEWHQLVESTINQLIDEKVDLEERIEKLESGFKTFGSSLNAVQNSLNDVKKNTKTATSTNALNVPTPQPIPQQPVANNNNTVGNNNFQTNRQNISQQPQNIEALAQHFAEQDALFDKEPNLNTLSSEDDGSISDSEWAQIQRDSTT